MVLLDKCLEHSGELLELRAVQGLGRCYFGVDLALVGAHESGKSLGNALETTKTTILSQQALKCASNSVNIEAYKAETEVEMLKIRTQGVDGDLAGVLLGAKFIDGVCKKTGQNLNSILQKALSSHKKQLTCSLFLGQQRVLEDIVQSLVGLEQGLVFQSLRSLVRKLIANRAS